MRSLRTVSSIFNTYQFLGVKNIKDVKDVVKFYHGMTISNNKDLNKKTTIGVNTWFNKGKDGIKIGVTNYQKEKLGNILDINFKKNNGDKVNSNEAVLRFIGVKSSIDFKLPFNYKILDKNIDILTPENLIYLSSNPECESHNWIIKVEEI